MTDIKEMADLPIEIVLGEKSYTARRPDLAEIFGQLEREIENNEIIKITAAAKAVPESSRAKFVGDQLATIPKGGNLQDMVYDKLGTVSGFQRVLYAAIKKENPKITEAEVGEFIAADVKLAGMWTLYLCGVSKKAPPAETQTKQKSE